MMELEKWKVSFCDPDDYVVSTFIVEALSSFNAIQTAMFRVDIMHDIRTVLCVRLKELEEESIGPIHGPGVPLWMHEDLTSE